MPSGRDATVAQLNREWADWAGRLVPENWPEHPLSYAEVLADIVVSPDERLGSLIARASSDARAGRVVLQAMIGKLVLFASRDRRHTTAEYVTECWLQLSSYPLARRPRRIAANLALDTRRAVWASEPPTDAFDPALLDELPEPDSRDPVDLVRAATSLGLIDRAAGACLVAVYCYGLPSHEAAAHLSISPELVRWRNARSLRRLAPHAARLAGAA